jgi:hypothetical protein
LGAGVGAVASNKVADALVGKIPRVPDRRQFRWIGRKVDHRPRATAFAIFLVGVSPLPDGTVVVPLAVVHYGMRRLAVPLFLGKLAHNLLLALLFYAFASWSAEHVSQKSSTELAVLVAVLFMVLVGYHAEKARAALRAARAADGPAPLADPPA